MNPLEFLLPALYLALNTPALTVDGEPVPAEQHFADPQAGHYVLIDQPTDNDAGGSTGCARFACTVLLQVVTQFPGVATGRVAEQLASQIHARLRGKRLALPEGWDCGPGLASVLQDTGLPDEQLLVRRLLRYSWTLHFHQSTAPEPVFTGHIEFALA